MREYQGQGWEQHILLSLAQGQGIPPGSGLCAAVIWGTPSSVERLQLGELWHSLP